MNKVVFRDALIPALAAGGYILLDFAIDRWTGGPMDRALPHIVLAVSAVLIAFVVMSRAIDRRRRAETALRQQRDEMETRIHERTEELARANDALQLEIAERGRVEAQIRHLASFPQLNPNPVIEVDALGSISFHNPAAMAILRALGVQEDARVYLPTDMPDILLDLNRKEERSHHREVRVGDAVFEERIHVVPAVGVAHIYAHDITEHKRAEEALRAGEEKYRLLFQNMAEGFALYELLYDLQGEPSDWLILEVNDAYTRHTGIPRDGIVGRRMSELFPAAIPEYLPRFAAVVNTQRPLAFETYARAVGRHQRVFVYPAGGHRFAGTIEDISERKRAEEALRASEEKFAAVFRFSPTGLIIAKAADCTFLDVNDAFANALGYSRSEVLAAAGEDAPPFAATKARDSLRELSEEMGQVVDQELDLPTKDGGSATMLVSLVPIQVGETASVLAVAHDITKRKQFEDQLRRAQVELAQVADERARMEERQRLARELHDSVSQALYGVSLGVNTALTLLDTDRTRVSEALHYALSQAQAGLTEMRALIFELRPESLQVEGLVAALKKQTAALSASRGIEVALSLGDEPDAPLAVKEALYRIAQQALDNAAKHSRADRLEVRLSDRTDGIELEVSDNGVGFDCQADFPGHLGLKSMHERAVSVGGELDITSAPGQGTRIRVNVPTPATEAA